VAPRDAGPSSSPAPKSLSLSSAGRDALGRDSLGRDPPRAAGAGATSSRSTRGRRPRGRSNSSSRAPESRDTESREAGSRATGVSAVSTKSAESATGRRLRPRVVGRRAGRSSSSALTRSTLARSTAGEAAGVESTASLSSASGRRRRTVPRDPVVPAAGRRLRVLGSAAVPSSSPAGFLAFGGGSSSPKSTSRSVNAASSQLKSSSGSGDVVLLRAIPHSVANTNTAKPSAHPGRSATHLICSRPGIIAFGQSVLAGPRHSRAQSSDSLSRSDMPTRNHHRCDGLTDPHGLNASLASASSPRRGARAHKTNPESDCIAVLWTLPHPPGRIINRPPHPPVSTDSHPARHG
jgi:hypothetical protein